TALQAWFAARSGVEAESIVLANTSAEGTAEHPELAALELDVRASERDQAAAALGALPDLTVEGGARWDAMPDGSQRTPGYEIGASVQLPIFERNRRETLARRSDAAEARATLERRRAELTSQTVAAEARIALLTRSPESPDPEPIWTAAELRYQAGESSLEELLQAAERVEAAALARIEHARRLRHAELDRSCAAGALPEPFASLVRETR
ncbi:MAG: TolC family protein, partial [Myxococcales bacterium]|nr:TolC family protein [Myxococcales bacterium]